MADTTQFGHDQLAHLLADHLLEVPRFQRSYAWDEGNIGEYLDDLKSARQRDAPYFMGTVVFAAPTEPGGRRQIVDGQQRLATTAILLIAIRDRLRALGKARQAEQLDEQYLRGYVLTEEEEVERLILSPNDQKSYSALIDDEPDNIAETDPLWMCYAACLDHLQTLAPSAKEYKRLIELATQLATRVQVLVAVASDLPEAYVIFETLNDRGADLTTADLLKNYLFSASKRYFSFVEARWTALEDKFEKPDDLVKFIRYEYVSRNGPISSRKLYRAIQNEVNGNASKARSYVDTLTSAQAIYSAIKEADSPFWADLNLEVRDAVLAYRRFGFEASIPILLAGFQNWKKPAAAKLLIKMAKWSIRAQMVGRIGGGTAEETFGEAARRIASGEATNQTSVRAALSRLIPTDAEFRSAFISYGAVQPSRAKYLLGMLEKAHEVANNISPRSLAWDARSVTVEHAMPKSWASKSDAYVAAVDQIGNLVLLERKLNYSLGSKPFAQKKKSYADSDYALTAALSTETEWTLDSITERTKQLAVLACSAWPYK